MKLSKELIGQSFPITKLPKRKVQDLSLGQFYKVVGLRNKTIVIKDDSDNEIPIYPSALNLEYSLEDKNERKQKFEDSKLGFTWLDNNLNIVLPEEYNKANDEDDIKETSWLIKADAFSKGAEMTKDELELMLGYLRRKNKVKEYQAVNTEMLRREETRNINIESLLK